MASQRSRPSDQPGPGGHAGMQPRSATMNYSGNVATAPATQPIAPGEKTTRTNKLERDHATGPETVPMDATGPRQAALRTSTASVTTARAIAWMRAATSSHRTFRSADHWTIR